MLKKQRLVLNSCLPGINTYIFPNRHCDNIFSRKIIDELHDWMENHHHVIHPPNVSDSSFVKINGTLLNKQKHIPQILGLIL